jgi:hypothetical protein
MKKEKEKSWTKKIWKNTENKRTTRKIWSVKIVTDKNQTKTPEANVSVFTKTTNPKVVIKTEKVENDWNNHLCKNKHKALKFFCFIIMCIIMLATFFLSLQTYNTVNKLAEVL